MKHVLVTGVTGFTGGYLCRRLIKRGYRVKGLALPDIPVEDLEKIGVDVVRGDLREKEALIPAVQDVDQVYHIAAVYREQNIPRKLFFDVNVQGTKNLLEVAQDEGVKRFIHCSTVGVQGEIKHFPATEESPYNPGDYYQESKMQGELLALDFFRKKGLPGVVFRPVGIYGPGDTRFLKLFRYISQGKFRMFGSGEVLYHLTYIDDLIDGILLVGETPNIEGEVFTLAGEHYTTLNELVGLIAVEFVCLPFRIQPPVYRRRVDFFIKDRAFDISKARTLLDFQPKVDLKTGLGRTAQWTRDEGLLK
jgi:nucleoside-diphosphate-sugar epimerase